MSNVCAHCWHTDVVICLAACCASADRTEFKAMAMTPCLPVLSCFVLSLALSFPLSPPLYLRGWARTGIKMCCDGKEGGGERCL